MRAAADRYVIPYDHDASYYISTLSSLCCKVLILHRPCRSAMPEDGVLVF